MNEEKLQIRNYYSLLKEPRDKLYGDILDYGLQICGVALLVVDGELAPRGESVLNKLEPLLISRKESSEWPGTSIQGGVATVLCYTYNSQCVNILKMFTKALYEWLDPEFPQDLCLLRSDGSSWLVSIAHEKDGYFYLTEVEMSNLIRSIPELQSKLSKDDPLEN